MSDPIDRQAAIDAILRLTNCLSVRELYEYIQENQLTNVWSGGINDAIDAIIGVPSAEPEPQDVTDTNVGNNDLISRQALRLMKAEECAGHTIEYAMGWKACIEWIKTLPSAQPEQPPYIAEIESEYRKAVNNPYIKKPLAKALYEVWKKHDRDDAERRVTDGGLDKQTSGD